MPESQKHEETISDEARQQVIGYLSHQASKSTSDLLGLVDRAAAWLEGPLESVSESQAQFCPSPGEWCIADVLRHVDASMRGTAQLVSALAAGKNVSAKMVNPPLDTAPKTLAELRRGVAQSFDEVRAAIAAIPVGAASEATAYHPFFGDLTCKEWAAFVYVHARDHADQIDKVKTSPGFPR
jgi:DinB superfamily